MPPGCVSALTCINSLACQRPFMLPEDLDMPQPTSRGSDKAGGTTRKARKRVAVKSSIRATAAIASRPRRQAASACKPASRRLREVLQNLRTCAHAIQSLESRLRQHNREQDRLRRQMDYFALGQKMTRTGSRLPFSGTRAE
jgi:hypothetical protein